MGKTAFVANMRILRNVFIVSGLVTVLLVIAAIGVHTALAADALSVSPKVTKDGLIGETSANWTFTITTATQLNPGDVVQFIFPNITSGAVPFDVSSATLVATSSADTTFNLYPTTSTSTAGLAAAQGPLGPTVYGFATTTIPANTSFTVTIGGIANAIGQLSSVQNLTFTAQAGTPSDPTHPEGPLSVTKYNSGGSLSSAISLTRSGGALVSDANSAITPSSTNVSATNVSYTFSITSHSTIVAGSKILINFPATYDISGATVATQIIDPIGGASVAAGAIATSTANNSNRAILTVSGVVLSGDVMTVTVGGITNPSIAGVYRPFSLFTTNGNGGLIDGSYFGFEPSDYSNGAPSPNDTVYIGGKNTLNIQVLKSNGAGGTTALSAGDIAQMKVAAGCPDRQYFMGQKWLDSSGVASYHDILDCNYMVGVDPFSATSTSFYSSYLPPGMKQFNLVSSSGVGQTATTTLVFGIPNSTTTVEVDLPNAVANAQAFVQAYSADNQSFSPIYTTPTGTTQGFDGSGHGYAHINIDRGKTWNFNVMGGQYGSSGNITDGSGNKYWAPQLPSINLTSASSSANLGVYTYTLANNTLNVTLQDTSNGAINNACVGVSRSGGGIFMGPQDMICTPNNNGAYQFKVPTGTVTIDVSLPGHGEPSEYPVAISGATTNKTITLAAPSTYVSVVVETSSGTKIKGAPVFANGGDGFGNAMTDNTGAAKIYVPPGLYSVQGFAPGFGSLTSQTATVANGSDPLVTFTVNTGTLKTISGTVTQGGLPVAGINIGAHGTGSTTGGNGTQTDTNGNYTLYLPAGTYEVGGWSPSTGGLAEQAVDVTSSDATGIDWALGAQGTLHLTIHNASTLGSLSAGAFDSTTGMGNSTNSWTTTGTDKVADITLPAGTHYSVQASTPGLGQFGSQSSVTITAGGTTNVSFDAASGTTLVSLSGSVTAGGSPVSGVNVWASRTDGPGFFSTQTDTNGAYSLTVPDGKTYHVGVRSLAYIASQGDVDVAVNGGAVQNFTLTAAGATITGKVLDANGNPVANGWVSAVQTGVASSTTVGAPTDAAGNYTLNVTNSSTWNLTAQGPCFLRSSAIAASAGDSGKNITLTAQSGCTKPVPQIYAITDTTGGQISTGNMTINIPPNALGTTQQTDNVAVYNTAANVVSSANATPLTSSVRDIVVTNSSGQPITSLNSTVSITTSYDPATLPANFSAANLQIGYFDSNTGQWEPVAATIDTTNHTFTMQVNHFTQYGPILNGVPSAPTGLTATAASASEIDLSWTASPTATSYTIYRSSTNSNFTTSIATGVTGTAYSDTGLSAGTAYYYEVAGVNANGEGLNSSSATAATSAASSGGGSSPGAISPVIVSSGGGGSSTATNPLPVPTPTPTVTTQKATSTPPASATAFTTPAAPVLTRSLYEGLEGDDVSALQTYLVEKGYLTIPSGTAEGYFGALTKAAVVRFQKDNGVDSIGIVGPATRAAFGVATAARATAASAASSGTTVAMFASNLGLYTSSADVQRLQTFLNQDPDTVVAESGPGSPGHETDYFGLLTERAVEKFQAKYGIVLSGTPATTGYGRVGPETRAKLNALR